MIIPSEPVLTATVTYQWCGISLYKVLYIAVGAQSHGQIL